MGAQFAKAAGRAETATGKQSDAAASPIKANGQENGHVKANGDASPAPAENGKSEVQTNGNATTEENLKEDVAAIAEKEEEAPVEAETEEKIEPVVSAEEGAKSEDAAPTTSDDTPRKKKFSFKKSFKLSGFSFKKTKKDTSDGAENADEPAVGAQEATAAEGSEPPSTEKGEAGPGPEPVSDPASPAQGLPAEKKPEEEPKAETPVEVVTGETKEEEAAPAAQEVPSDEAPADTSDH